MIYAGMLPDNPDKKYVYIYTLSDVEGNVRYVGKSYRPLRRYKDHLWECLNDPKAHNFYKNRWLRKCIKDNTIPKMTIIECVDKENDKLAEKFWIAYFRDEGCCLTNLTDGGEGLSGWKPTDEQRKRSGDRQRGKIISQETREKLSKAGKGRKKSEEHRRKIGEAHRGRTFTEETLKRMSEAQKRRIFSVETKQKMAESRLKAGASKSSTSKYKGVCLCSRTGKYRANIAYKGVYYNLGTYISEIDAAKAYDEKVKEFYGDAAYVNFPS
jgi:hypothetical protein